MLSCCLSPVHKFLLSYFCTFAFSHLWRLHLVVMNEHISLIFRAFSFLFSLTLPGNFSRPISYSSKLWKALVFFLWAFLCLSLTLASKKKIYVISNSSAWKKNLKKKNSKNLFKKCYKITLQKKITKYSNHSKIINFESLTESSQTWHTYREVLRVL